MSTGCTPQSTAALRSHEAEKLAISESFKEWAAEDAPEDSPRVRALIEQQLAEELLNPTIEEKKDNVIFDPPRRSASGCEPEPAPAESPMSKSQLKHRQLFASHHLESQEADDADNASGHWLDTLSEENRGTEPDVVPEKAAKAKGKSGGKWQDFTVEKWRSAVYINQAYFGQLCTDTTNFIVSMAEQIKLGGPRVSLVEVGCGTGEFTRSAADAFRVAVGVDFNQNFIEFCNKEIPKGRESQQRYIHGDATRLVDLMEEHFPKAEGLLWDDVRIVACVGNTIGIIPQDLKESVYKQMLDLAGEKGLMILAYWNGRWFGDAVQNFYHANPQLCGTFTGDCIDLSTNTLKTPSGYCTHWTTVEEARGVMEGLGVEIVSIRDVGKGVLVAARKLPVEEKTRLSPAPGLWYMQDEAADTGAEEFGEAAEPGKPKTGGKWADFTVEKWRSAVYINRAYFGQLCTDTTAFIVSFAEQIKLSGSRVSLVEVGCGTGEFVRDVSAATSFRVAVGVDFNQNFIEFCRKEVPKGRQAQQRFVHGDATKLVDLMEESFPKTEGLLWDDARIVACVGNTIGIIPQDLKETVYKEMLDLAGPSGILIMAYWNGRWFGDAVQNFYHANPQLCGKFEGESIDLSTSTLKTPSGYCTHWTTAEEARGVIEALGAEIIALREMGKGVLVAARKLPTTPPPRVASGCWYNALGDDEDEEEGFPN